MPRCTVTTESRAALTTIFDSASMLPVESSAIRLVSPKLFAVTTMIPLFWLTAFGRHKRIAFQGDWTRAARRGAWVGLVITVLVVLRLQGALELPIALFMIALVVVVAT